MIQATHDHQMGARSSGGATRFGGYALATDDHQFSQSRQLDCLRLANAVTPPSASGQLGRGFGLDRFSFIRLSAVIAARRIQIHTKEPKMTATASKESALPARRHRRANLRLVSPVNLEEMERVLTETAQQMAPMVSRANAARQAAGAEITALRGEREGIVARRDLMERMFAALTASFDAELADIDATIAGKLHGIEPREAPAD